MKKRYAIANLIIGIVIVGSLIYYFQSSQIQNTTYTFNSNPEIYQYVTEFPTQSDSTSPNGIAVDAQGNVWFLIWNQNSLAELIPQNGTVHEFRLPRSNQSGLTAWGITIDNANRLVWFTDEVSNSVWKFNIANNKFTQYLLPSPNAFPYGIAIDGSSNVWFTELFADKIGEISQGQVSEFSVPLTIDSGPAGITIDRQNKAWFTLTHVNEIGSFFEDRFTLYNLSSVLVSPVGIAMDDLGNLWITQHGPSFVSEFNPSTGLFRTISTSIPPLNSSLPYFVQIDENNNVWFNEHQGNAMAEFSPTSNSLVEYVIPSRVVPVGNISGMLTMGLSRSGQAWFVEIFTGKVGTVNSKSPPDLGIKIGNQSITYPDATPLVLPNGSHISVRVSISNTSNHTAGLKSSVGNFTENFRFSLTFTPDSGEGNFSSILTIQNNGSKAGIYFLTVSAATPSLVVSQVVEVEVP